MVYVNGKPVSSIPNLSIETDWITEVLGNLDTVCGPSLEAALKRFSTHPVASSVVAKPDTIHVRWLSGEIASLEAIDELVEGYLTTDSSNGCR
jgi:hypothetical protein